MSQTQQASGGPSSQQTFNPSVNYCLDFIMKLENRSAMVLFQLEVAILMIITIYIGVLSLLKDLILNSSLNSSIVSAIASSAIGIIVSITYLHTNASKVLWALEYCDIREVERATKIIANYHKHDNYIRTCVEELLKGCKIKISVNKVNEYSNAITELYGRIGTNWKKLLISSLIAFSLIIISQLPLIPFIPSKRFFMLLALALPGTLSGILYYTLVLDE